MLCSPCRQISENVWQIKKITQKQKAIILKLQNKTSLGVYGIITAN
jgi:hypothetical protein